VTDPRKVDLLVQYAVGAAAREDFPDNRLGPIHILKYIYLADLAFAQKHGTTFTEAPWTFFHFGPWCPAVHHRIQSAVSAARLETITVEGDYGEFIRYFTRDLGLRDRLEPDLPIEVSRAIDKALKKYGTNTPALLEAVYLTKPMRFAAPGDTLVFDDYERQDPVHSTAQEPRRTLTAKQEKNRNQKLRELKERVRAQFAGVSSPVVPMSYTPPRYDEVFTEGTHLLNQQQTDPVEECDVDLTFDDSIWESDMRRDEDVP
jgi:hypothetical protein